MPLPFLLPILSSAIGSMLVGAAVGAAIGYILDQAFKNVIIPWLQRGSNTLTQQQTEAASEKIRRELASQKVEEIDIGLTNNHSTILYANPKNVVVMEYDENSRFVKGTKIYDEELRHEVGNKIIIGV